MQTDNRNMILAIVLSLVVLFGWQFFIAGPQLEQAQRRAEIEAQQQADQGIATPTAQGEAPAVQTTGAPAFADRAAAIAAAERVTINTASVDGSISLVGGRLDDLHLKNYRETVDPTSPEITLFSPAGVPNAYFVEQGWVDASGRTVPAADAQWTLEGDNQSLSEATPVTLRYEDVAGLVFRRTFAVDENYLFTVTQSVENQSSDAVTLFPYSRVARHGTPQTANFFILHEGPIGVLGDQNLIELTYSDLAKEVQKDVESAGGWLGFTDKYWAAAILPEPGTDISARFSHTRPGQLDIYQTSFVSKTPVAVEPGAAGEHLSYVFAGAKVESIIDSYEKSYGFDRIELLID